MSNNPFENSAVAAKASEDAMSEMLEVIRQSGPFTETSIARLIIKYTSKSIMACAQTCHAKGMEMESVPLLQGAVAFAQGSESMSKTFNALLDKLELTGSIRTPELQNVVNFGNYAQIH